jgi:hypothetical protein
MAPRPGPALALLGGLLLLGGCTGWNNATAGLANGISNAGGRMSAPWGSSTPRLPEEALTVERVRYAAAPPNQLSPEPGDVWPKAMPPRSTLANPDAALRGIPDYQPPSGVAAPPSTGASAIPRPPGPNRGSSSPPPPPTSLPPPTEQLTVPPPQPRSIPQMPPRADGQVLTPPGGPPVVTSGGTDRVQSFNVPGGGTGTAIRDGNTTTLISPDGRVQVVPSTSR